MEDEFDTANDPYVPTLSLEPFLQSDKFISVAVGPVGSTKTSASIIKIALEAAKVAKSIDGKRRSRCAIVRNTKQQLFDTTLPDFLSWFPAGKAGSWHKTDSKFILEIDDIYCEILFRGLDDAADVKRLLSLQLTFAMIDEAREIHKDIFDALTGRVGRYPSGRLVPHRASWGNDHKGRPIKGCVDDFGKPMKKVWAATNPPSMDTFWYEKLSNPPSNWHVTIQPSGLSDEADWRQHLDPTYYEDLMPGKTKEWIDVYVHGKWGVSLSGKPVFRSFNAEQHIARQPLNPMRIDNRPLVIGMDFGLNPSVAITQLDAFGRLLVLADATSDNMGALRFIQTILKPMLNQARFIGMPVLVVGDPAGTTRAQSDEKSCFDMLKSEGIMAIPARTNSLGTRLGAVEIFLTRIVDGQYGFLVDPGCTNIIKALRGDYRYKLKKSGEYEPEPDKSNMASHIADALQYACLHAHSGIGGLSPYGATKREIKPSNALGWT